jgi:hypothetical protein
LGHGNLLDRAFREQCVPYAYLLDAVAAVLTWLNISGDCPKDAAAGAAGEVLNP